MFLQSMLFFTEIVGNSHLSAQSLPKTLLVEPEDLGGLCLSQWPHFSPRRLHTQQAGLDLEGTWYPEDSVTFNAT